MVDKHYIEGKVTSIDNTIGYICKHIEPQDSAMIFFLTKTLKGAIENAAHSEGDMENYPECSAMIWTVTRQLLNKFVQIKNHITESMAYQEDTKKNLLNELRWCFDRISCIIKELEEVEFSDHDIEETHTDT